MQVIIDWTRIDWTGVGFEQIFLSSAVHIAEVVGSNPTRSTFINLGNYGTILSSFSVLARAENSFYFAFCSYLIFKDITNQVVSEIILVSNFRHKFTVFSND